MVNRGTFSTGAASLMMWFGNRKFKQGGTSERVRSSAGIRLLSRAIARAVLLRLAAWISCAGLMLCLFGSSADAETRIALVIGNSAYAAQPLRNARADAQLMARTLRDVGFEVIEALDADAERMRAALTAFNRSLKAPDAVALFYFAGHGVQSQGENYLIPVGAGIVDMSDVAINALALADVMRTLANARTRLNIVILDACRDNPFATSGRNLAAGGLAPAVAPSGTFIGYATAPGQTARDGSGANSPYTAALAFNIPRPGTTLEEVFRDTRRAVLAATAGQQVPWEHSSLVGAFYFKDKPTLPETSAVRLDSRSQAQLAEIEAWEAIRASASLADLRRHISNYPNGLFAELAAVKIAQLQQVRPSPGWSTTITGSLADVHEEEAADVVFARALARAQTADGEVEWRTIAQGHLSAAKAGLVPAMAEVARAYDAGRGVPRDLTLAAYWYREAAERGHAPAMAALGTMYEFGDGVERNLAEALRLYRLSADRGDAAGLTSLAYLMAQGKGAAKNAKQARKLYARAAEKGFARAQFNLALMELAGEGGRRSVVTAVGRLRQAAQSGHAGANEELAWLHDQGFGVARDPTAAARHLVAAITSTAREGHTRDIGGRQWSGATLRKVAQALPRVTAVAGDGPGATRPGEAGPRHPLHLRIRLPAL